MHSLETCPPLTNEPKCTNLGEWRSVTLRPVPNDANGTTVAATTISSTMSASQSSPNFAAPVPVAPPRRKRSSATLQRNTQPGGFKDVFGHLQRRASVDSVIVGGTAAATPIPPKRFNSSTNVSAGTDFQTISTDPAAPRPVVSLKRKVSKVGNKKSDKFFGENLSDCLSDEHIDGAGVAAAVIAPTEVRLADELDAFVQNNAVVVEAAPPKPTSEVPSNRSNDDTQNEDILEPHSRSSLDRKAEFLMTMLENHSREEESRYHNRTPVEEPLIVPKRKHGRHICDDDDHMKRAFGAHEQHLAEAEIDAMHSHGGHDHDHVRVKRNENNRSQMPDAIDIPTPKKPDRIFSKKSPPADDYSHLTAEIVVERPTRRKSSLSREKLPKPPPTPTKSVPKSPVIAKPLPTVSSAVDRQLNHHLSEPFRDRAVTFAATSNLDKAGRLSSDDVDGAEASTPALLNDDKLDSILKKCNSSHSFLTPDLMDQIINKVYGFKMNWDNHDIRRSNSYDDGSTNVAPISKLKPRKISVIRNKETMEKPIMEECLVTVDVVAAKPSFSIGDNLVTVSASENEQITPLNQINHVDTNIETNETRNVNSSDHKIESDLATEGSTDIIDKNASTFDEIVSAISVENPIFAATEVHQHPMVIKRTNTVIELQKSAETTTPQCDSVLDHIYTRKRSILDDLHHQIEAKSSEPSSDNEESEPKNHTHASHPNNPFHVDLSAVIGADASSERRGSIVDCDDWFNRHTEDVTAETPPRRDSNAVLPPYDMRKLFPFGRRDRERSYSESSDCFFEDSRSVSSSTEQLDGEELVTKLRQMRVISPMATQAGNDHSTLLKYLDGEKEK